MKAGDIVHGRKFYKLSGVTLDFYGPYAPIGDPINGPISYGISINCEMSDHIVQTVVRVDTVEPVAEVQQKRCSCGGVNGNHFTGCPKNGCDCEECQAVRKATSPTLLPVQNIPGGHISWDDHVQALRNTIDSLNQTRDAVASLQNWVRNHDA